LSDPRIVFPQRMRHRENHACSANATDFFNSLLGLLLRPAFRSPPINNGNRRGPREWPLLAHAHQRDTDVKYCATGFALSSRASMT
jgi:hypothetical protein